MWNGCTTTTAGAEIYVAKHHHKREALPCRISWCDRLRNFPSLLQFSTPPPPLYYYSQQIPSFSNTLLSHSGLPRPNYNRLTSSRNDRCISNCRIPISKSTYTFHFFVCAFHWTLETPNSPEEEDWYKNIFEKWCIMKNSTSRKCRF